jgi:glycosyltransferase involved in cell wall biosynthesis
MNVLFLTPRFYPDIGGVETHVLEIGKELIKKNHTVSLITEQNSARNNESPATNIFGINIMRLDFGT